MKEKHTAPECRADERQRSATEIRKDIESQRETISRTVDRIGSKIQGALDWRHYVRQAPYVSLGLAAGAGALLAAVLARRETPLERIMNEAARKTRRIDTRSLVLMGITTLATKAASTWARQTVAGGIRGSEPSQRADVTETLH